MNTKYLIVDDHTQCKEVEHIREMMPYICIPIFPGALRIEAIRLSDTPRLVISSY